MQVRWVDQTQYPMIVVASLSAVPQSCRTPLPNQYLDCMLLAVYTHTWPLNMRGRSVNGAKPRTAYSFYLRKLTYKACLREWIPGLKEPDDDDEWCEKQKVTFNTTRGGLQQQNFPIESASFLKCLSREDIRVCSLGNKLNVWFSLVQVTPMTVIWSVKSNHISMVSRNLRSLPKRVNT